jgi:hypothetical protein
METMTAYGGNGKAMPAVAENMGCDGDDSTYDPHCVPWYYISHCTDLADGKELGAGFEGAALERIKKDISQNECDASQDAGAYMKYVKEPKKWNEFIGIVDDDSFAALSAVGFMVVLHA